MHEPAFLLFASDATLAGLWGGALLLVASIAILGERRRLRRKSIDAVGWVPWTTIFLICFFAGAILLALAVKGWVAG
jgi:hypothetical protein